VRKEQTMPTKANLRRGEKATLGSRDSYRGLTGEGGNSPKLLDEKDRVLGEPQNRRREDSRGCP
jgi:hypothetical protein